MDATETSVVERIANIVREMPPEFQQGVEDFVQFLFERRVQKPGKKLRQDWTGASGDLRDQYTAAELQHKISGSG